jgi:surface antigen
MRKSHLTVAALAAIIAAPAPGLAQPSGSPLSSIFSCQAAGNRQQSGAIIGGIIGGVIGNQVADNERGLGTVLGAAAGAAAGSYIGCRMQTSDQQRAEQAAQLALERGQSQTWENPQTGARGRINVVSTQPYGDYDRPVYDDEPVSLAGLRFASGVQPQRAYASARGEYSAPGNVNVRGGPSTSAPVVTRLRAGDTFEALARVEGTTWLLAGRNGVAIGYVSEAVVRPVDRIMARGSGEPLCRTFDQTYTAADGRNESQRYTACQTASGEWVVQG